MYQYLIFDLDDTLLDFKRGEREGLRQVLTQEGLTGADLTVAMTTYEKINRQLWQAYEEQKIDKAAIHNSRFNQLMTTLGLPHHDGQAMEARFRAALNQNNYLIPYAKDLLASLQDKGYTLIAGTNGETRTQQLRLEHTGLGAYFDQVYISDQLGVAKPAAGFFETIFAANPAMTRQNTVMIGDGLASDMRGAHDYGLATIWVNLGGRLDRPADLVPTAEVHDLQSVIDCLEASA